MSTLDQMQAFVAVIEEGSFTAAALRFNISPTAMCKKVSVLEKSLNTRLLTRTPRLITMTDIGKKYYTQCKRVLHEYKLSHLLIEDSSNNLHGTLNIICIREIALRLTYPSMAMFLEHYPHILTNVTIKKQYSECMFKDYDIAIGYENSGFFDDWCGRKMSDHMLYYPNRKPTPLIIQVYIDYLTQYCADKSVIFGSMDATLS
jgi:DNA-binding transcriptional LysR family regulator